MKLLLYCTLTATWLAAPAACAQQVSALYRVNKPNFNQSTGRVRDARTRQGIPGVLVQVKATDTGFTTDYRGYYTLDSVSAQQVVSFSSIGYIPQERKLAGQTVIPAVWLQHDKIVRPFREQQLPWWLPTAQECAARRTGDVWPASRQVRRLARQHARQSASGAN